MFNQIATYIMIGWFAFFLIGLALSHPVHRWLVKHRWAIDKEIPMKPTPSPYIKTIGICKSCEDSVHRLDNYCPNCGQKIDWSEE